MNHEIHSHPETNNENENRDLIDIASIQAGDNKNGLTRRRFLQISVAAAALAFTTGLYAWQIEPHWLEIVRRALPVLGLPTSLDGARLIHISDIHVGPSISDEFVLDTFDRVASLQPDIVVVTGDFTSYHSEVLNHAERIYSQFPHGRIGTVGVLGNHDYGPGWADSDLANRLTALLQSSGIHILRNEHLVVSGLQIVGMDDLWANNFQPSQAIAALDPNKSMLALSHNPDSVDLAGWDGFKGWILSGHTHGGQCKPPFLPPPLLPVENRNYTEGEFTLDAARNLYINRGVGHLLQIRLNVRPEITVFELQSA